MKPETLVTKVLPVSPQLFSVYKLLSYTFPFTWVNHLNICGR